MVWTRQLLRRITGRTVVLVATFALANGLSHAAKVGAQSTQPLVPAIATADLPLLRRGTQGQAVQRLQFALISQGFYNGRVTGIFDPRIETAVKQAQQRYRLRATGVVDTATWRALLNTRVRIMPLSSTGAPGLRQSAATRERCPRVERPLTALIPSTNLALTVSAHPTFWVYVPYSPNASNVAEFVLQNDRYQDLYQIRLPSVSPAPGIVSIRLPPSEAPLAVGKRYYWYFLIYCDDPQRTSEPAFITGAVERIPLDPTLRRQLEAMTSPWQRLLFYSRRSLWSDALTTLAEFRRTEPNDATATATWANLLRDADLEEVESEPIVPCCNLSPELERPDRIQR